MKRPVVFLLLGPSLVALAVWMVAAAIAGRIDDSFVGICAITAFLLTLPVSGITGLVDGYLARGLCDRQSNGRRPTPARQTADAETSAVRVR